MAKFSSHILQPSHAKHLSTSFSCYHSCHKNLLSLYLPSQTYLLIFLAKSAPTTITLDPSFPSSLPSTPDLTNQVFVDLPIPSHSTSSQPSHPHSTLIPDPISPSPPLVAHTPFLLRNNIHGMITCAKLKQNPSLALHVSSTSLTEPKTLKSALKQPKATKQEEIDALQHNNTWNLVPRPPNTNIIGSKWFYHIKYYEDGNIERFKS